jgi:hypothetical protein
MMICMLINYLIFDPKYKTFDDTGVVGTSYSIQDNYECRIYWLKSVSFATNCKLVKYLMVNVKIRIDVNNFYYVT